MNKKNTLYIAIGTVAILATAGLSLSTVNSQSSNQTETTKTNQVVNQDNANSQPASQSVNTYRNGIYVASVDYKVPHNSNSIQLEITITNDKIASVKTNNTFSDGESGSYISSFEQSLNTAAVGKSVSSFSPSRIGGASLTTDAFNQAMSIVKNDAKI